MLQSTSTQIEGYITRCKAKIDFHKLQASSAKLWSDLFKITKIISSSSAILTISLLTVFENPAYIITVTSSVFIFFNGLIDRAIETYNFPLLASQNDQATTEFSEILFEMERNPEERNHLIQTYILLESKHKYQIVKACILGCIYV